MRRLPAILILLGLASSAGAQWGPTVTSRDPARPDANTPPIAITRVRIETKVLACLAETTTTLTLSNPGGSVLEADLHFALPPGAVVNGYALDVGGRMVDGVSVSKDRGRFVFDDIVVRQRRDPGLIEHDRPNEFNVRVFPVPARGERTVSIRYLHELPVEKGEAILEFPLRFAEPLAEFAIRVDVLRPTGEPNVVKSGPWNLRFDPLGRGVPRRGGDQGPARRRRRADRRPPGEGSLVASGGDGRRPVLLPDPGLPSPPAVTRTLPPPRRIVIYWDGSGSRGAAITTRKSTSCGDTSRRMPDRVVEVELVIFRHVAEPKRLFRIEKGDASALLAELRKIVYDGATQLGCIPAALPNPPRPVPALLRRQEHVRRRRAATVDRPCTPSPRGAAPDEAVLRRLALRSGGEYCNLSQMEPAKAAEAIGKVRTRLLGRVLGASSSWDPWTFPSGPQELSGPVLQVGKCPLRDDGE